MQIYPISVYQVKLISGPPAFMLYQNEVGQSLAAPRSFREGEVRVSELETCVMAGAAAERALPSMAQVLDDLLDDLELARRDLEDSESGVITGLPAPLALAFMLRGYAARSEKFGPGRCAQFRSIEGNWELRLVGRNDADGVSVPYQLCTPHVQAQWSIAVSPDDFGGRQVAPDETVEVAA